MSVEGHRVAIVGAGIFGCAAALVLAEAGCRVSLFERRPEILAGATKNNLNRLHLGFHYPRHLATARQSAVGFQSFTETFAGCVSSGFPNAYFVAEEGSVTSPERYLAFCRDLGQPYREIDPASFPTEIRGCRLGVRSDEPVYDRDVLKQIVADRLAQARGIELRCGTEVSRIAARTRGYALTLADGTQAEEFEAVVNCSYAEINRLTGQLGHPLPVYQHEYTVVPVIRANLPRLGFAIMDGPFASLLPYGKGDRFLLYHVKYSVVATELDTILDPAWYDPETAPFAAFDKEAHFATMRDDAARFVPALRNARLVGFLEGPRVVLAHHHDDDARPSLMEDHGGGYHTVFSGKVDHSMLMAWEVRDRLSRWFSGNADEGGPEISDAAMSAGSRANGGQR